jgi:DNA-binding winged helix-turn-helix (wHTH) protein
VATSASTNETWRFGVYEIDTRRVELRGGGTPVKMREQSFLILCYLLEHAGEIVTREELRGVLWPSDTFVDFDHSLNVAVMHLRDVLGDSTGAPVYIETIPRHGYRFIAPLAKVEHQFVYPMEFPEATPRHLPPKGAAQIGNGKEIIVAVSGAEAAVAATDSPPKRGSEAKGKKLWKIVVPSAVLLLVLIAVGFFYRWGRARLLTNKDTIVLADFDNKTGDTVFDDTLKQGLSVQLEQSPFLDLLSERRVNETLKLMGRSAGERLTPEVTQSSE